VPVSQYSVMLSALRVLEHRAQVGPGVASAALEPCEMRSSIVLRPAAQIVPVAAESGS
jgi:hypothetical protein